MTVYQHEGYPSIFACTVDGYCNIISYKKNEQGGELIVTSKVDICLNTQIIRIFYRQRNYAVDRNRRWSCCCYMRSRRWLSEYG